MDFITSAQLCATLHISRSTLWRILRRDPHAFGAMRVGSVWRFPRQALTAARRN
jgi:predicted DNA-binding transcriptional regulator AlpA